MPEGRDKDYWQSLDPEPEPEPEPAETGAGRRSFLKAAGFALAGATLAGCAEQPAERALPYVEQPTGVTPGRPVWYASTCHACPAGCGLLVKCRDGRPIKLEGLPDHPVSRGGLCAVGQAHLLGLYDSHRLTAPRLRGEPSTLAAVDRFVSDQLTRLAAAGGRVRVLTGTVTSPTEQALLTAFRERFGARHVVWDALSHSALREAHELTHGVRSVPGYRFDRAALVVSVAADFLGTWLSPVQFTRQWAEARDLSGEPPRCQRHVQLEATMSLTGSNADERLRLAPAQLGQALAWLAGAIAARRGEEPPVPPPATPPEPRLPALAAELWARRGRSLVVCGLNDVPCQTIVNYLNEALGNYGQTLDFTARSFQRMGLDDDVRRLLEEVERGEVDGLLVAGCNPLAELPGGEALARVPLLVVAATHLDETAAAATAVVATSHPLEQWTDSEAVNGTVSVGQPVLRPRHETRAWSESLAAWLGRPAPAEELLRDHWRRAVLPRAATGEEFEGFWRGAVERGWVAVQPRTLPVRPFRRAGVRRPALPAGELVLVAYPSVALLDGRHAENPWLQELPDPLTKATWDNLAALSPATAAALQVTDGDLVTVTAGGASIELPVVVQPGQADGVVAVALGYGRAGTKRFADLGPRWFAARPGVNAAGVVGANVVPLLELAPGLTGLRAGVTVTPTGRRRPLALAQEWGRLEVPDPLAEGGRVRRPMIQETTLAVYTADRHAGGPHVHEFSGELWPADHRMPVHHWAMAIDLQKCTGCSACVVACGLENNLPVVGRDEVRRRRDLHWLRLDRYYSGPADEPDVAHQPMLCHHCDNAPCEVVCPVLATVHSEEGLNQQVYNRCVGTRYCANNCPYKVRRFNWFDYPRDDEEANLALNPDVTVRSRGVMEKCSFCVQRIEAAKIAARSEGREVRDGDVQPACAQSCPAGAIVFGDLNDPASAISRLVAEPRHYRLLEELNVKPSVGYLRLVRHRTGEEEHHG